MATDFAPYANLRMLWARPVEITDLRNGIPVSTDLVVIEAFVKGGGATPQELPSLRSSTVIREGFITQWAELPEDADWLAAGSSWSWSTDGLMPPGLQAEARGRAYLGPLEQLPTIANGGMLGEATILELGGQFGVGGIGAELRAALGDAIRVSFARVG